MEECNLPKAIDQFMVFRKKRRHPVSRGFDYSEKLFAWVVIHKMELQYPPFILLFLPAQLAQTHWYLHNEN